MTWLQPAITSNWHTTPIMLFDFLQTQHAEKLVSAGSSHVFKADITSLFTIWHPSCQSFFFLYQLDPQYFLISFVHIILENKVAQFAQMFYVCVIFFSVSRTGVQNICLIRYPHVLDCDTYVAFQVVFASQKNPGIPASKLDTIYRARFGPSMNSGGGLFPSVAPWKKKTLDVDTPRTTVRLLLFCYSVIHFCF